MAGPDDLAQYAAKSQPQLPPDLAQFAAKTPVAPKEPMFGHIQTTLGNMAEGVSKNLWDVSAPGIGASLLKRFRPGILPQQVEQDTTPLKELPNEIGATGAPMMAGGILEEPTPANAVERPRVATGTTAAAPEDSSMMSRIGDVAKRRLIHKIPGIQAAKDLDYVLRGTPEAAPAPPKPPTPTVPDFYGKGKYGTPVAQWGQPIAAPTPPIPPELTTPARTLPGQISPEVIRPPQQTAASIPARSGLALPPGPEDVPATTTPRLLDQVNAWRARSVGEEGIPYRAESHAQATMSPEEAQSYMSGREDLTGQPQEVVGVDLSQSPGFSMRSGPRGADWVKFHGEVPESAISRPRLIDQIQAEAPAAPATPKFTPKTVEAALDEALGNKKVVPGVRLRDQVAAQASSPAPAAPAAPVSKMAPVTDLAEQIKQSVGPSQHPQAAPVTDLAKQINLQSIAETLPEGFKPVDSQALKGYKYNPEAREFEYVTKDGQHYVRGDVDPEAFQKFEQVASDKGSFGKAWAQLRSDPRGGVGLFRVINGERVPVKAGTMRTREGVMPKAKAGMRPDLEPGPYSEERLIESLRRARAARGAPAQD